MSARARPCDMCRLRKTRCVRQNDEAQCILCAFHDKRCTYLRGPRRRPLRIDQSPPAVSREQQRQQQQQQPDDDSFVDELRDEHMVVSPETETETDPGGPGPEPQQHCHEAPLSLLDGTLGLDLDTHPQFVGTSSHREPALLDLQAGPEGAGAGAGAGATTGAGGPLDGVAGGARTRSRRVNDRNVFLICPDDGAASESQRLNDCDAIEESVGFMGKALVQLYFRLVHASFPVLHKGVFLAKHAISHQMFSPPLLAAVYLVALDYHVYDSSFGEQMAGFNLANGQMTLEALADRTMAEDLRRPKLSTLQAGLLLLQRSRAGAEAGNWMFAAQMIALAQGLGLHADCQGWAIPDWEKSLRRRLGWSLYMQDRWGACVHGRPPLLSDDDWDLQVCTPSDFPEPPAPDEVHVVGAGRHVDTDSGAELFIRHTELAQILTDVIRQFYATAATKPGGRLDCMGPVAAVEMAKPLMLQLRSWQAGLPDRLRLESTEPRRLSANASLHVAHLAVEVALHRALVRLLTPATPSNLAHAVRLAAKNRVQSAIGLMESLRPEHMGAFWGGSAAYQIAIVGSLTCLLWATSDSPDEMEWCVGQMEDLRWVVRVRAQGAVFMKAALRLIEADWDRLVLDRL